MWLIFLGPPGSGKGTQSKRIAGNLGIAHISTGDMLRNAVLKETPAGLKAKSFMGKGQLVPDSIINNILEERLEQDDCKKGFILDGFPRNLSQAERLTGKLEKLNIKLTSVIEIKLPYRFLEERICGRRSCTTCGTSYHIVYSPPKNEGLCNNCGKALIRRNDDTEEVVKARYDEYVEKTRPLSDYYTGLGILHEVNGELPIEELYVSILDFLKKI